MRRLQSAVSLDTAPPAPSTGVDEIVRSGSRQSLLPYRQVPVDWVEADPSQPRQRFDPEKLERLAEDIRRHGIDTPLSVRTVGPERFLLLAGERRLRAARMAGLATVPIFMRDDLSLEEADLLRLRENLQREDLSPLEEARGLKLYKETTGKTWEEVGREFGWKKPTILEKVRLLDAPEPIRAMIEEHRITPSHYTALAALPEDQQIRIATVAASERLSMQDVRRMKDAAAVSEAAAPEEPSLNGLNGMGTQTPQPEGMGTQTPQPEGMGTQTPQPEGMGTQTPQPEGMGTQTPQPEGMGTQTPQPEGMGTQTPQPEGMGTQTPQPEGMGTQTPQPEGMGTQTPQPVPSPNGTERRPPLGAGRAEIRFYTTPEVQVQLRHIAADLSGGSVAQLSRTLVEWFAGQIAAGHPAPWLAEENAK